MENYTLSVIIPNYNNEKYIRQCVESIAGQTYPVLEIVIVDDCSTDGSEKVIRELQLLYQCVKPHFLKTNGGVSHARNMGISLAAGEYISFLDADDLLGDPHKLENEMRLIRKYREKGADVVAYSKVLYIDEEGRNLPSNEPRLAYSGNIYRQLLCTYNTTIIPRDFCIKKDIVKALGGYREDMNLYEDYELTLRIARNYDFYDTNEAGTAYRIKSSGLSSRTQKECDQVFMRIFYENLKGVPLTERIASLKGKLSSYCGRRVRPRLFRYLRALKKMLKKTAVYRLKEQCRQKRSVILFRLLLRNFFREGKQTIGRRVTSMKCYREYHRVDYQIVEAACERPVYLAPCFEKKEGEVSYFQSPEIYVATLKNISVIGGCGALFTKDCCILDILAEDMEGRADYVTAPTCFYYRNKLFVKYAQKNIVIQKGIFLCGVAPFNYYHFVVEMMSRLAYAEKLIADKKIPLLIDEAAFQYLQMSELLERLNTFHRPVVKIKSTVLYRVKELIYPSMNTWFPVNVQIGLKNIPADFMIAKTALTNLRDTLLQSASITTDEQKIYISRKKKDLSRLLNEEGIEKLFIKYGFEIIYPEELSLSEQIRAFAGASAVAGVSGAAFTNIIFCRPQTEVICIIPMEYEFYLYSTMAYLLEERFVFLDAGIANRGENPALSQYELEEAYCERMLKKLKTGEEL